VRYSSRASASPPIHVRLAAILLTATVLSACLTTDRPSVADSARATMGAPVLPASGTWQDGDEEVRFATVVRDTITEVAEQITFGTDGIARRTVRIGPQGHLLSFSETRTQTAQATDRSPSTMEVEVMLEFAADSVVRRTKRVDGVAAPVREYEIAAARAHVAALLTQFATPRPTLPPRN
jgi:hypothetical protein